MQLPKKKGTEEGITNDILKGILPVINEEFVNIIKQSLKEKVVAHRIGKHRQ